MVNLISLLRYGSIIIYNKKQEIPADGRLDNANESDTIRG